MEPSNLAKLISSRRQELGISMAQLARKLGLERSTISRWEGGSIETIKRAHLYLLSKELYLPIEMLLGLEVGNVEVEDPTIIKARLSVIESLNKVKNTDQLELIKKFIDNCVF